jgi:hypothetical protein
MKALSLWQPWASLVALGEKRYETRSWSTPYSGLLLIHAAKKRDAESLALVYDDEAYREALGHASPYDLPYGAILSVHRLVGCHRVEVVREALSLEEKAFGNYTDGRFAWELEFVARLEPPIPCKGRQQLFEVDPATFGGRWIPPIDLPSERDLFH